MNEIGCLHPHDGIIYIVKKYSTGNLFNITLISPASGGGLEPYMPPQEVNIYGREQCKALRDMCLKHMPLSLTELKVLTEPVCV